MNEHLLPLVIAAASDVPQPGGYTSLGKIAAIPVLLLIWAAIAAWIDHDTDRVKTRREYWNLIVLSGGLVGFFVLFLPPWTGPLYFAGLAAFAVIAGSGMVAYVIHRNGRVVPEARVLTAAHFKRLMEGSGEKKAKQRDDKGQRVLLYDHEDAPVSTPDDPDEREDYFAVQDFLFDMLWRRGSDVDVLAGREKYRVVHRIDGVATELPEGLPPEEGERVFRAMKRIAGLNPEEIRRPQTGSIQLALLGEPDKVESAEVHTSGTTAGERLRIRTHASAQLMRAGELGISPQRLKQLEEIMAKPHGLFLISAAPQSGMTTTQYAILRGHDAYMQNIHSLERKRLLELDNVTQQTYDGSDNNVDFARMLQSVLRREPDIVLIGECEDKETARIATRGASDERKVYMGMRASDAFEALQKYLQLLDDNEAAASVLLGVSCQRLVRKLCTECREAFRPDPAMLKKLNLPTSKIERFYRPPTEPILDKKGHEIICPSCHGTGYVGRTGVFELLVINDEIRKLIQAGAPMQRIKAEARKARMYYLQEEALLKVIDGTTSMNEVLRVLKDSHK